MSVKCMQPLHNPPNLKNFQTQCLNQTIYHGLPLHHGVENRTLTAFVYSPWHLTTLFASARAPSAGLPNTAAFLGGMVAQETIKVITKQYIPVKGYCVIDLVDTWTGMIGA
ncbi:hypothetical protein EV363DRAFT_1451739 [Boletus edulis]|nr:hypothetical protein EV363DRAFT_1451739 [Boletus edulis]